MSIFRDDDTSSNRVKLNKELRRIESLPRRIWEDTAGELAKHMTAILKRDTGSMTLRHVQATTLYELAVVGGVLGIIRVGGGKTLISFLAPVVSESKRPMMLIPAKLRHKTKKEWSELNYHWVLPNYVRTVSYEELGREAAADLLEKYQPDLIIGDEIHKLKNPKAARTRRVKRYMAAHPDTKVLAMSGTITKRSLLDFAHILKWVFGHSAKKGDKIVTVAPDMPLPDDYYDLELWADALDERKGQKKRADPGALRVLCTEDEHELWLESDEEGRRRIARRAYRRRLVETPGVVSTKETPIDASILVSGLVVTDNGESPITAAFTHLRNEWETPDGWSIPDGLVMHRHARELAMGFYYRWNPRPPDDWLSARYLWHSYVRRTLAHSQKYDSEGQLRNAMKRNEVKESDIPIFNEDGELIASKSNYEVLQDWLEIKDTFIPNTETVWIDDYYLQQVVKWAKKYEGIIWVEHTCVGEKLQALTGLPYYAELGVDKRSGANIESHKKGSMIASIESNYEGRNLQHYNRNLMVSMPPNGLQVEQWMGRTHRDGQEEDEVYFDILLTCAEHVTAFWQAMADAKYTLDLTGSPQKLLLADVTDVPSVDDMVLELKGPQWDRSIKEKEE